MAVKRYPEALRLRLPRGMPEALSLAAGRYHTTPNEWVRQVLLRNLQAEGVSIQDGKAAVSEPHARPGRPAPCSLASRTSPASVRSRRCSRMACAWPTTSIS